MFPQFGSTAASFTKASTMVFRIGTDAHLYDDPEDVSISPLLDSKFDSEKAEALKRLLALIAQGCDVVNFFPQVAKNVASQSLEVKKLVYLYLLHYAEKRPNEALLSINCFQKDLSDLNPLVRAWSLRAMAGIRLHVVAPLVLAAIGKCARDPSTYVRKCAANALPKLYDLHLEETYSDIEELVTLLLNDNSPTVVGAAAAAFNYISPGNLVLIGRNFRRLCEVLPDVDEWGQTILIGILLRYTVARYGLADRSAIDSSSCNHILPSKADSVNLEPSCGNDSVFMGGHSNNSNFVMSLFSSYVEGQDEFLLRSNHPTHYPNTLEDSSFSCGRHNDVKILLQCTSPLLWSQNSSVVLAAVSVHWIMAPMEDIKIIVNPILFLLRSTSFSQYVVLCNLIVFTKAMPALFAPHFENFFIHSSDAYHIRAMKLEILSIIATGSSIPVILQEFQDYIIDPDRRFVADTIHVIGLCAQRLPEISETCLKGLLGLIRQECVENTIKVEAEADVLSQTVIALKEIIKQDPGKHEKIIIHLVRSLDLIKVSAARALIIWMLGEYCMVGCEIPHTIPVILKYLAWSFGSEGLETKQQILNTATKVVVSSQTEHQETCIQVLTYVLELVRVDVNYDVRDRARIISKLLACHLNSQKLEGDGIHGATNVKLQYKLAEHILYRKVKPDSYTPTICRFYLPGSLSHIVLHAAPGYEPLPKPCSLANVDLLHGADQIQQGNVSANNADSLGTDPENSLTDADTSESSEVEERSSYSSRKSGSSIHSSASNTTDNVNDNIKVDETTSGALIHLSDDDSMGTSLNKAVDKNNPLSLNISELILKEKLESWLGQEVSEACLLKEGVPSLSSARLSVRQADLTFKQKVHKLLDPTSGNGLSVDYSFSSEISNISRELVCMVIIFENHSAESLTKISVTDEGSLRSNDSVVQTMDNNQSLEVPGRMQGIVPTEEITCLHPGQIIKQILHVHFDHHLLPVKLFICCNGKRHPVKLRPDMGYFVKPLPLDLKTFIEKEAQLPGMFEYTRRCTFVENLANIQPAKLDGSSNGDNTLMAGHKLASLILSNVNVSLVSINIPLSITDDHMRDADDVSGLCLRFSSEILSSSVPCLLTVVVEGRYSGPLGVMLKINCEETIFGLNLLNRVASIFT